MSGWPRSLNKVRKVKVTRRVARESPSLEMARLVGVLDVSCEVPVGDVDLLVLDCSRLANPYTAVQRRALDRKAAEIAEWMLSRTTDARARAKSIVDAATLHLQSGKTVSLCAYGGTERIQAVAFLVIKNMTDLDLPPPTIRAGGNSLLSELVPFSADEGKN